MLISVKSNLDVLAKDLKSFYIEQLPYATSQAINATAFDVQRALREETATALQNPTPFTTKAWMVRKANKRFLMARVYTANNRGDYFPRLVYGGLDTPKKRSLVQPVDPKAKNKYGNIPNKRVQRLLSNPKKYFSGTPKGKSGRNYAGVWEKEKGRLKMIIHYHEGAKSNPAYLPYSRLRNVTEQEVARVFETHFGRELGRSVLFRKR